MTRTTAEDIELDVRMLPHQERRALIFYAFERMEAGLSFVLVNDHDPARLRNHFEALHSGGYRWEYLERGPRAWRVRITKPRPASR